MTMALVVIQFQIHTIMDFICSELRKLHLSNSNVTQDNYKQQLATQQYF